MARYVDLDQIGKWRCPRNIAQVREWLYSLPVEDVKPVTHAYWIKSFFPGSVECGIPILLDATCSHCEFTMPESYTPYCPYCGAKMDEEVNHDKL